LFILSLYPRFQHLGTAQRGKTYVSSFTSLSKENKTVRKEKMLYSWRL
jgi:hypothetical protein